MVAIEEDGVEGQSVGGGGHPVQAPCQAASGRLMPRRRRGLDTAATVGDPGGGGVEDEGIHPVRVTCQAAFGRLSPHQRWCSGAAATVGAPSGGGVAEDDEEADEDKAEERKGGK